MKKSCWAAIFVLLLVAPCAFGDSLWCPSSTGLCVDIKAHKVGDILTIIVSESAISSQKASTDFSRDVDHANGAGQGALLKLLPELYFSSGQSGAADGSTSRTMSLSARITATVKEVLPNGNLVIEGVRAVKTNNENHEIRLTGTVRKEDVAPDNTVLSTYVADAKIDCTGKGIIGDRQKDGLITKILNFLF